MSPGTVFFFEDFVFADGDKGNKLVIVLNSPKGDEPYLLCPTTSQQHKRKKIIGCHAENNYYYIDEKQDRFVKNTWVVFHKIYPFSAAMMVKQSLQTLRKTEFTLEQTLWRAIKNCILKSKDIDQDYLKMIGRS